MQFPTILSAVIIAFATLISAQAPYGRTTYLVSDCDGTTNVGLYMGTPATINGATCVTWPDSSFKINEETSDAVGFVCEMAVYADPNCQVDGTIYPGGVCYVNVGSFAIQCQAANVG